MKSTSRLASLAPTAKPFVQMNEDDNFKKLIKTLINLAISGQSENYKMIIEKSDVDFILSDVTMIFTKIFN